MTREEAIRHLHTYSTTMGSGQTSDEQHNEAKRMAIEALQREEAEEKGYCHRIKPKEYLSADAEWIPCSERLPKDLEAVNVTWVNHNPPCYYIDIMNVPFTATGVYHDGKWYWWDATVMDLLGEYDGAYVHGIEPIDQYIEITAWMPLPTPYKGGAE